MFEFGGQTRINPLDRLQSHPPSSVCQNYVSEMDRNTSGKLQEVHPQPTGADRLRAADIALNLQISSSRTLIGLSAP